MAVVVKYFCTGTCGAVVSEEEYAKGLTVCGAESCTMHKKPFEKGLYCETCKKRIKEEERSQHQHENG